MLRVVWKFAHLDLAQSISKWLSVCAHQRAQQLRAVGGLVVGQRGQVELADVACDDVGVLEQIGRQRRLGRGAPAAQSLQSAGHLNAHAAEEGVAVVRKAALRRGRQRLQRRRRQGQRQRTERNRAGRETRPRVPFSNCNGQDRQNL